jgi:hypothetical protein
VRADRQPDGVGSEWGRIRGEGRVQAGDRLVEPVRSPEGPGQPGQVPAVGTRPHCRVAEPLLEVDEEAAQRADVLVVVAHDGRKRLGRSAAEEAEVAPRDLPAVDVVMSDDAEQRPFDGRQAGVVHPVAEQPAHDRQEVEVAGVIGCCPARQSVAGDEQRPVEAAPVVGHEPGVGRDVPAHLVEHHALLALVRKQKLDLAEGVADPPAEADQEGHRAGGGREAGRLGVEADERTIGRRLAWEPREATSVDRQVDRVALHPDMDAGGRIDDLAVHGGG